MSQPNSALQAFGTDRASGVHPVQDKDTVKLIYKPVARRVTHQVLVDRNRSQTQPEKGRFGRFEVERLFSQVWDIYCELMPQESGVSTDGNRMKMRMTCLTIALFGVLSDAGIDGDYAMELISEIAWKTHDKWRLFSGMNQKPPAEVLPQNDTGRPVPLPVPYYYPGGYRQVDSRQRERTSDEPPAAR